MLTGGPGGIAWSDFISLPLPPPRTLNYTCWSHRGSAGWGLMGCWKISSCIMEEWIPFRIMCVCVSEALWGGMSLGNPSSAVQKTCEEHMNYKSHLHKTCVSVCERVWNTKCIWRVWLEVLLRFQRVNVGVLLRLHAQQRALLLFAAHSR